MREVPVDGDVLRADIFSYVGAGALETRMDPLAYEGAKPAGSGAGLKGLMWIAGALATVAAAGLAAVLAIFFAATVVVIGLLSAVLISLGAMAYRTRKALRPQDPNLIEARHIGGHSWVAYGWDQRGR